MEIAVRYGHPILTRTPNPFQTRPFAHLKFNRFELSKSISSPRRQMSTQSNLSADNLTNNKPIEENQGEKKSPPPPEKPEAGDCCGSGCVRCVWDVYYEELEDYNKRYKTDSKLS